MVSRARWRFARRRDRQATDEHTALPDNTTNVWDIGPQKETDAEKLKATQTVMAQLSRALRVCEDTEEVLGETPADVSGWLDALPADAEGQRAMMDLYLLVRHNRPIEEQERLMTASALEELGL
jgi:hypothetical protein